MLVPTLSDQWENRGAVAFSSESRALEWSGPWPCCPWESRLPVAISANWFLLQGLSGLRSYSRSLDVDVRWRLEKNLFFPRRKVVLGLFAQEGILLKAGISRCYYTWISVQTGSHAPPHSAGWKGGESKAPTQPLNLSCWWRPVRALAMRTGCCSGLDFSQNQAELGKPYHNFIIS